MKKVKTLAKVLISLIVILCIFLVTLFNSSPKPFVNWLRSRPEGPIVKPSNYSSYEDKIDVKKDLVYPSNYDSNTLDIYYPKDDASNSKTILWIHGGAFVSGDKSGTAYWCTMMASKGYTVISMNYSVAPEFKYPTPVNQVFEVFKYLNEEKTDLPMVNLDNLIIGGDSAGAQIASQFIAIQTNDELTKDMNLKKILNKDAIKASLLFCGPYDMEELTKVNGFFEKFFLTQIGWAYLGDKNWKSSQEASQASTVNYITSHFPPTFLTDGNTGSFESHARELESKLKDNNVPVESLFFSKDLGDVGHEYQFDFSKDESIQCFDEVLNFLDKY